MFSIRSLFSTGTGKQPWAGRPTLRRMPRLPAPVADIVQVTVGEKTIQLPPPQFADLKKGKLFVALGRHQPDGEQFYATGATATVLRKLYQDRYHADCAATDADLPHGWKGTTASQERVDRARQHAKQTNKAYWDYVAACKALLAKK